MAKSLRSKRMRRNRAVKRERIYAPKELARLKKTLEATAPGGEGGGAEMRDLVTVRQAADVVKEAAEKQAVAGGGGVSEYDSKTLRNAHGAYPPWMNQRRVKQHRARLLKSNLMKRKGAAGAGGGSGGAGGGGGKKAAKSHGSGGGGKNKRIKKKSTW